MIQNKDYREYVQQYKKLHSAGIGAFSGRSLLPHAWHIVEMVDKHQSKTILDYGCGAGEQYSVLHLQDWFGIMPTLYDPGVEAFSAKPEGQYDGVIVSDVMEHIPESAVQDVVADIVNYGRHWVFFSICCREAKRILPNGKNAHCTIKTQQWWTHQIKPLVKARGLEFRVEWSV